MKKKKISMVDNIIKDFEELIKSEKEFWEKFKSQYVTSAEPKNWLSPEKEVINAMIAEVAKLSNRYKELLNSVISKLTLEQKLQIDDLICSSMKHLVKLYVAVAILIKQNKDAGEKELLIKDKDEILELNSKYWNEINQEIKKSYWDLQDKFIQKFGETCEPFTIEDPHGDRVKIRSFFGHVVITNKKEKNLFAGSRESYEIILKALKLNPDETKEEKVN